MKTTGTDNCMLCGRRDFLKKMGFLAGTSFIAPGILSCAPKPTDPSRIPDKKGALKVRVVYSLHKGGEVQNVPDWPNIDYDFNPVMKNMTDALNAGVRDVEFIPVVADTEQDGQNIIAEDEKSGDIAGYIVVQMNPWKKAIFGIVGGNKPTIFACMPYGGGGGWLIHNSRLIQQDWPYYEAYSCLDFDEIVDMAGCFSVLKKGTAEDFKKKATQWRLKHTPAKYSKIAIKEGPLKCLSPEETLAKIKGMKILSVCPAPRPKAAKPVFDDFGVLVEHITFEELEALSNTVDPDEASRIAREWIKGAASLSSDVNEEIITGSARLYLAMKQSLKDREAQAITVDCLHGCYSGALSNYPCLGFMQLQDDQFFGICENDLRSTVSMIVGNAMTGRMGYVSDPVIDMPTRSIIYAHCVSTRKFLGPDSEVSPYSVLSHAEDHHGAAVRVEAPAGYPMTTFKFNFADKSVVLHTSFSTGSDDDDRACRTKIVAEVTGDMDLMHGKSWDTFGWHRVSFFGDFAPAIEAFAQAIGYTVVRES